MSRSEPVGVDLSQCETHIAIRITMMDGTILRYGSAQLVNVDDGSGGGAIYTFTADVIEDSSVKQSLTRQADQAQMGIQNVDRDIGLTLNTSATALVGAKAVVFKVFVKPDNSKLFHNMLDGEVAYLDADENIGTIKIVSDTAPNVAFISNRRVQSHCPLVFKGKACGYSGVLTTCNKLYEDAGGCSGRENQHRFGGIVIRGELSRPIPGGIDTEIEDYLNRYRNGELYPDLPDGRHRPTMNVY